MINLSPNFLSGPPRIYLAAPYTHPDPKVRQARFEQVTNFAAELMNRGALVFSPITHSHPLADKCPDDPQFWERWYMTFLKHWANHLYVLQLSGWDKSKGVAKEIAYAGELGIPIVYIPYEDK